MNTAGYETTCAVCPVRCLVKHGKCKNSSNHHRMADKKARKLSTDNYKEGQRMYTDFDTDTTIIFTDDWDDDMPAATTDKDTK